MGNSFWGSGGIGPERSELAKQIKRKGPSGLDVRDSAFGQALIKILRNIKSTHRHGLQIRASGLEHLLLQQFFYMHVRVMGLRRAGDFAER